ncbi:MAG: 5-deoxy-glucuronate isomerase [Vicinamibacterales bacterium]
MAPNRTGTTVEVTRARAGWRFVLFAVRHGDVVLIRSGYHPFVTAYGYNAYYLNVVAGTRRSMAASDDPKYAAFRSWPAPDVRVPIVAPPVRLSREAPVARA